MRITVSKLHTKTAIALKITQLNKHMAHLASMLHRYTVPHLFPLLSFKKTSTHKRKDVMWARSRCPQSGSVKVVLVIFQRLDAKADGVRLQKGIKLNEIEPGK